MCERIDRVSLVTPQFGAGEVPNLGRIDDADDMTSLVQLARDAETISPGGLQTGMNPSDFLADQPIQEMAPSVRRIRKALCAYLVATRHARVEGILETSIPNIPSITILSSALPLSKSPASNNLVRRIYARARPKIPSSLNSGAQKTGA